MALVCTVIRLYVSIVVSRRILSHLLTVLTLGVGWRWVIAGLASVTLIASKPWLLRVVGLHTGSILAPIWLLELE